jgi:hypothetical protein
MHRVVGALIVITVFVPAWAQGQSVQVSEDDRFEAATVARFAELALFLFFGAYSLLIDGYKVDLFAQRCKLRATAVVAFVCGEFLGIVSKEFPVSLDGRSEKFRARRAYGGIRRNG